MEAFINALASNPFAAMVIFLSIAAAVAFLIYAWGFIGYITSHGHDEHQQHARVQMIWGMWWLVLLFILWQIIRWAADFFGY